MSFDTAWSAVADVEGWMTEGQGRALFDAAAAVPEGGTIVEIGSFQGRSTIVVAMAARAGVRVIAIDPHAGNDRGPQEIEGFVDEAAHDHERFNDNLRRAGVIDRVEHLRVFSDTALDAVPHEIDMVYVDGAHRYAPARADIAAYGSRVIDGGALLIHDSFSSVGVTCAILRELLWSRRWRYVSRSRSLAVYRADAHGEPAKNAVRQALQLPWFARNLVMKLALTLGMGRLLVRFGRRQPDWPY